MICPGLLLSPTKPPTIIAYCAPSGLVPLRLPVANEPEIVPLLKPAKPPIAEPMSSNPLPLAPLTVLDEDEFVIVPSLRPTRPPAKVLMPVVTVPDELDWLMLPPD